METKKILAESNGGNNLLEDKQALIRFMSKCGFSTIPVQVEGTKEDGSKCFKTVWTLEKHKGCKGKSYVSLSFVKESEKLRLTYPHPYDAREIKQTFDFDVHTFMYAYNEALYKRSTPKDYYMSFDDIFFKISYPKANKFVRFCFYVFAINPTIVRRCIRQNKNLKRKIDLEVKNSRYFEVLGLERKIIKPGVKNALKMAEIDVEKEQIAKKNMQAAIKNAAIHYDLNYFKFYLSAYIDLKRAQKDYSPVSKRAEQKLLDTFITKVKDFQKNNTL